MESAPGNALADLGWEMSQGIKKRELIGLSLLAEKICGKPLDKSVRMSNWNRRPLSEDQLQYAALDAHVLLVIHDYFAGLSLEDFSLSDHFISF